MSSNTLNNPAHVRLSEHLKVLARAAELLVGLASDLMCFAGPDGDWAGEPEARAQHDEMLRVAGELRGMLAAAPEAPEQAASPADVARLVGVRMSAAAAHLLRRMQQDGRLAYLIGPGSQAYDLLTQEAAQAAGRDVDEYRQGFEATLRPTPWPSEGEILDRIEAAVQAAKKEVAHG